MIPIQLIEKQLQHTLDATDFKIGKVYEGKVRDNYTLGNKRIIVTTDRISAFDRVLCSIPFKGQVLTQMAAFWFEKTKNIVPNHLIEMPDQNVMVVKEAQPLPIEMVVRGYITGVTSTSAWTHYKKGVRNFCGNILPEGLKKDQKFEHPIVTPSTKADKGDHDESISVAQIIDRRILDKTTMEKLSNISLQLFDYGVKHCAKQGIILVDTKYEFGLINGEVVLMDEIHTPDSSRFWFAEGYQERFSNGEEQKKIDKEYVRTFLANKGFIGDGPIPHIPDEVKVEAARRYIEAYELITGNEFVAEPGDILARIKRNIEKYT